MRASPLGLCQLWFAAVLVRVRECDLRCCALVLSPGFGLSGVRVHKKVGRTVVLDQTSYGNSGINPISVDTLTVTWIDS